MLFEEVRGEARFDPAGLMTHPPFTQSYAYGEWQRAAGRTVRRFIGIRDGACVATLQLVQFPLLAGRSYFYAPYGPIVKEGGGGDVVRALYDTARDIGRGGTAFVRFDFSPPLQGDSLRSAEGMFRRAPRATYHASSAQPRAEWVLNLAQSEEELFRGMHHNTRYSIRAAERRGVRTETVGAPLLTEHFDEFYKLMEETAARDGFFLHSRRYYEAAFRVSAEAGNAFLIFARHEAALLAAHFIVLYGGQAHFVFGGSSSAQRELFGSYAAQWMAIREAKSRGATRYNFGGVSSGLPAGRQARDVRGNWEGLSNFKRKFGGTLLSHSPFFDFAGNRFWYYAYVTRKYFQSLWR
ncbi:MAG: peptidoglycan bridge formation glycyltransferase FemA/FemB family protein [Candidatus Liptonbacteria bacterium]|nr:peptidoglycan bridge formation glycyltransferase FemA/FemB family protein [Candidatus Liptonbacteria bacterium]